MVWPALWPPLKRATTWTFSVRRSTIFPLPSSPHWAPTTTMLGMRGPIILAEIYLRLVTSPAALLLDGNSLTLEDREAVARSRREVGVSPAARAGVVRARKVVDDAVSQNAVVYGVNTGFGNFADVVIPAPR